MDLDEWFATMKLPSRWDRLRYRLSPRRMTDLRRSIRWGVQRWRRGYSDLDVWSIDHFLVKVIPPMMRQLSRELHGVPGHLVAEHGDLALVEWRRILEDVAAGFEAWSILDEEYPEGERRAELEARFEKGAGLLIKHFGAFWD